MKQLKFLIAIVAVFITSGVMAVTLPNTSYAPYGVGEQYSSDPVVNSGTMITGHFQSLGDGGDYSECTSKSFSDCTTCCGDLVIACYQSGKSMAECETVSTDCNNACGRSLPLDGGLGILLVLSVLGGALKSRLRRS